MKIQVTLIMSIYQNSDIYQKIHSTNKNNLFNCDEDSNIFLQLHIVVHYYIFSTIHPNKVVVHVM